MVYPGRTLLMAGFYQSIDEWTEGLINLSMSNMFCHERPVCRRKARKAVFHLGCEAYRALL